MTTIDDNRCQSNRKEIYDAVGQKVSMKVFLWVSGIIATVMIGLSSAVLAMSVTQGKTSTKVDEQEKLNNIGQRHRESWQTRMEDKIDQLLINSHKHDGSSTP